MDCRTARTLIDLGCARRAGELLADDARRLDVHLGQCPDCRILAADQQLDAQFEAQLASAGKALSAGLAVPEGLRDRLFTRLAADRFAFYRNWSLKIGVGVAAVAGLILALYLWLKPDPEKPAPLTALYTLRPLDKEDRPADSEDLRRWFYSNHGVDCEFPAELKKWDLRFLVDRFVQAEFGHGLPTLLFRNGGAWAKVTILHEEQFDPESLSALLEVLPAGCRVLGTPGRDPSVALVVVQSGAFEDFVKK